MPSKNDILKVTVVDMNHDGIGIAKYNGIAVFIKGGVTGDVLNVKVIKVTKSYLVARTEEILVSSPYRTAPLCPHSKRCGGCVYQGITYEYEKELKENRLKTEFKRFGVKCNDIRPLISAKEFGYRNKLQCPVSAEGKTGFYAQKTHEIIPIERCLLQEELTVPVFEFIKSYLASHPQPSIRHIYLRCGAESGEVMVCFVCYNEALNRECELVRSIVKELPQVKSIILNINPHDTNAVLGEKCITLYGNDYITDTLCGLKFKISPLSFYQVNHSCTELLYKAAAELADVTPNDILCDLYCGIGTIGLCINSITPAKRLIGVEVIPDAIKNAKENAELNGVKNAEFYCSTAESFDFGKPDILVVDPPRKGLAPSLISTIEATAPKKIIYISCSPDTLSRDCAMLQNSGYEVVCAQPFNMFPRTAHVETIVCLTRKRAQIGSK